MHLKERKREKVLFLCLTVKSEAVLSLCGGKYPDFTVFQGHRQGKIWAFFSEAKKGYTFIF